MNDIQVVCFGEILCDNLKEGRQLGGAPLNVCYHLMKMGIKSAVLTQIGDDKNGKDILAELTRRGIDSSFCLVKPGKPTSTVEVITDGLQQVTYDIVENVAWDFIEVNATMEVLVEKAEALVFGSLIARSATSRQSLFRLLAKSRFRVFDVNLRAPFYHREGIVALLEQANLLKLNEDELQVIMEWLGIETVDMHTQLQAILSAFPSIQEILLTLGAKGSLYYSAAEQHFVTANRVEVRDTVGSGDSFLAAFLAGKLKGKPVREALEQASLLSGFIATRPGACPIYDQADLISFKESLKISH